MPRRYSDYEDPSTRRLNRLRKKRPCPNCGLEIYTDRCHRICRNCNKDLYRGGVRRCGNPHTTKITSEELLRFANSLGITQLE